MGTDAPVRSRSRSSTSTAAPYEAPTWWWSGPSYPRVWRWRDWVLEHAGGASAFYDIDTPVTIGKLRAGEREYLAAEADPAL